MARESPMQRTLAYLREEGALPWVVERWVGPHGPKGKRVDLYGLFDLVALDTHGWANQRGDVLGRHEGIIGVQVCAGSGHAAHRTKMRANPTLALWRRCGGRALLISWSKRGARGEGKHWAPRIETL